MMPNLDAITPLRSRAGALLLLSVLVGGCASAADVDWSRWNAASENVAEMRLLIESEDVDDWPSPMAGGALVFRSDRDGNSDVWLYDPGRGQGVVQLTNHSGPDHYPSAHPDGKHFVFLSDRAGEDRPYFYMGEVGKPTAMSLVQTSRPAIGNWSPAQISPDGSRMVYTSGTYMWLLELGTNVRIQLIEGYDAAWADEDHLLFRRKAHDFGDYVSTSIWMSRADGTDVREIIAGGRESSVSHARLSPNRNLICYTRRSVEDGSSGDFGPSNIYVARADGTGEIQLTTSPGYDSECEWMDDHRIVFTSNRPVSGNEGRTPFNIWVLTIPDVGSLAGGPDGVE